MMAWLGGATSGDVLILGFPSSGKSTYLWALHDHLSSDRIPSRGNHWRVSEPTSVFGAFAREFHGKANDGKKLQTTQYSPLELFRVYHRFLWWVPGGIYNFRVTAPDVPGEWISHIASGATVPKAGSGWPEAEFEEFRRSLFAARAFVLLLGGCTANDAAATLEQEIKDFVELVNMLKEKRMQYRSATFVLGKADQLVRHGKSRGRATFRIATAQSYLARWGFVDSGAESLMKVRLRDQFEAAVGNRDDMQVPFHHALAMDYLRSFVPKSSNRLDKLWQEKGYRLGIQVMFGSSLGLGGSTKPLECRDPINLWPPILHSIDRLSRERGVAVIVPMMLVSAIVMLVAGALIYWKLLPW